MKYPPRLPVQEREKKRKQGVLSQFSLSSFEKTNVKMDSVGRDMPFHQIQFLDSIVQILDDNVYPIVRFNERVNVRL